MQEILHLHLLPINVQESLRSCSPETSKTISLLSIFVSIPVVMSLVGTSSIEGKNLEFGSRVDSSSSTIWVLLLNDVSGSLKPIWLLKEHLPHLQKNSSRTI